MKNKNFAFVSIAMLLSGCSVPSPERPIIPSLEYANYLKERKVVESRNKGWAVTAQAAQAREDEYRDAARARLTYVKGNAATEQNVEDQTDKPDYYVYHSTNPPVRDYNGPLSLGDPGISSSLYQESKSENDLYRDARAWQPMDLITILVSEKSEGSKEADTQVKEKSTLLAALQNLLGFESEGADKINPGFAPESIVQGSVQNDFKGEGETTRKGALKATISAMVVDVLPSGILRIEGEKIISVNSEEQVMVITGLIRPRDISSNNEVDSSRIANMRIDYYGKGTVGEAQNGGWLSRFIRRVWPL